jgi:hypothetical protein
VIQRTEDGIFRGAMRAATECVAHTGPVDVSCVEDAHKRVVQVDVGQQPEEESKR